MSASVMAPAVFRNKVSRSISDLRNAMWHLDTVRSAAGEGDQRCKEFVAEHGSFLRDMETNIDTWRDDVTRITNLVEERSAKSEGKVFCDLCHKNVKNLSDHQRRSSSHKGRVKVQELDDDPNWERVNDDTRRLVEVMLSAPPPTGAEDAREYQWTNTQNKEHRELLKDRMNGLSDVIHIQNYRYHASGKEDRWGGGGESGGKYWVRPHINAHAHHLDSLLDGIRTKHNLQRYGSTSRILLIEFHKMVDPIIRNPNDIARHAAMYALQLDSKGD